MRAERAVATQGWICIRAMDNATAQTSYDGGPPGRAPTKGSVNASVDDPLLVVEDGSVAASGATILQTTISVIKVCIGAGVLALPYAFSQGGLVVGSIGLSGIALWNYWTTMMLKGYQERQP